MFNLEELRLIPLCQTKKSRADHLVSYPEEANTLMVEIEVEHPDADVATIHPALRYALGTFGLGLIFVVILYIKVAYNAAQDFALAEESYTHGAVQSRYHALWQDHQMVHTVEQTRYGMRWSVCGNLALRPKHASEIGIWRLEAYQTSTRLVSMLCKVFTFRTRTGFPRAKHV